MKKALVLQGTQSCIMNRNFCQKIRDYLFINNYELVLNMEESDIIFYSGCGNLEASERGGLEEIWNIKNAITSKKVKTKLVLVGCLPKINKKTKGYSGSLDKQEKILLSREFGNSVSDQFIIVDNDEYNLLDQIIHAQIAFEEIPYPMQVDEKYAVEAKRVLSKKDKNNLQQINFRKYISYFKLIDKGVFYPIASDFLELYGFRHVVIGEGCKNNCTYCAIIFAKREVKSVKIENIIKEISELKSKGYTKYILLCDDLASWGIEINQKWTYLLNEISKIDDGTFKIALINVNAADLLAEKKVLDIHVEAGRICYIEAMAQHLNEDILVLMNRSLFDKKAFIDMVNEYGNKGIHINTNFIVGFPGETEKEFVELIDFINQIKTVHFALYCVPFSERKGTPACLMEGKISAKIKKERIQQIKKVYMDNLDKRLSELNIEQQKNIKSIYETMGKYYENKDIWFCNL